MTHRAARPALAAVAVLLAITLAGCGTIPPDATGVQRPSTAASGSSAEPAPDPTPDQPAPPEPVVMKANVADRASEVKVSTVVAVTASAGSLRKVTLAYTMKDRDGKIVKGTVPGRLAKNRSSWAAGERLEPAAAYTLTMVGTNASDGATTQSSSRFSTAKLTLDEQTFAQLYPLRGMDVGVGMPVVLTFDVPVKNRKAFEQHLSVRSSPAQAGSWRWFSDKEVHFRPQRYWRPGTKVQVRADLNGLDAGGGVYGQNSTSTSFTVGRSLVTKINLRSKRAKVYIDGDLARTIPISAGKSGWLTRSGTKLIMEKLPVTRMTNQMIGAAESYDLRVRYAMRITWSGEFLHAAPWNAGNFGRVNASHGCVGMSTGDAAWLFSRVNIGDPVVTTGSSRGLEDGNGWTDWEMSFSQYRKGSAL